MKKFKKTGRILALSTACFCLLGSFVGCGGNDDKLKEGKTVLLKISPFNGGYGLDWLDAIVEEYEKENPEVQINYSRTVVDRSKQMTAIRSGVADCDLYFTTNNIHAEIYSQTEIESINEVYEAIGDNINSSVKQWFEHDGNYYSIPWATGVLGFLYHKDFFDANNISLPRTTNELFQVADNINSLRGQGKTKSYAFTYCDDVDIGGCYLDYPANSWFAQYEGLENYENYWKGTTHDGRTGVEANDINSDYTGILRVLEEYERMLLPSNNYNHPKSKDDSFTEVQSRFLSKEAIMMINGDWIVQEMRKGNNFTEEETKDVTFMPLPVISSMVETMPLWQEADGVVYRKGKSTDNAISEEKRAKYDKALATIIDYVDGAIIEKPVSVEGIDISDDDIARVREARSIVPSMPTSLNAVIPSSAKQKAEAKKFLTYMYSKKGSMLYAKNVYGGGLPVSYTDAEIAEIVGDSLFMKDTYDMINASYFTFAANAKSYIFSMNGLSMFYRSDNKSFVEMFAATAASNYENAYTFYTKVGVQTATNWDNFSKNLSGK